MVKAYNNKYDGKTCKREDCAKRPLSRDYCSTHYYQWKRYGITWKEGQPTPSEVKQVGKDGPFSTTRFCLTCKTVKHWTQYHFDIGMCADCHREWIKREVDVVPQVGKGRKKQDQTTMADLMDYIDSQVGNDDGNTA